MLDDANARLELIVKDRRNLLEQDLSERIKWLDTVLGVSVTSEHPLYLKSVRCLQHLCHQAGRLPASYQLQAISVVDQHPVSSSALSDVYEGVWQEIRVAIKVLRIHRDDRIRVEKIFRKEVVLWKYLHHPHIVPLLGITDLHPVCLVSRWMVNGTVASFLKANPSESRVRLALEIVSGLQFMHDLGIVHGDLKSTNVLVNEKSEACLVDFGLATAVHTATTGGTTTDSSGAGGTLRWMAPELCSSSTLDEDAGKPTKASDVYALAMLIWELFSGEVPFFDLRTHVIREAILGGRRPERPHNEYTSDLDDPVWGAITQSWADGPSSRPDVPRIRSALQSKSLTKLRHVVHQSDFLVSKRSSRQGRIFGTLLHESLKVANALVSCVGKNGQMDVYGYVPFVVAKCGFFLKQHAAQIAAVYDAKELSNRVLGLYTLFEMPPRYGKSLKLDDGLWTLQEIISVFRIFLILLPEPVIPARWSPSFVALGAQSPDSLNLLHQYSKLIRSLPVAHQYLLLYVLDMLFIIEGPSIQNQTDIHSLAAMFYGDILSSDKVTLSAEQHYHAQSSIEFLILNYAAIELERKPSYRPEDSSSTSSQAIQKDFEADQRILNQGRKRGYNAFVTKVKDIF